MPVTIVSLQPRKLEAVMPATASPGKYDLVITAEGRPSRPFPIEVAPYNPGIFSRNLEGWGPGRIDNLDVRGNRSDNSAANPAHPGQKVSIATTGMGGAKEATVVIGTRTVVGQASTAGVRNGEERVTFDLPADATPGCWVPVYIQAAPQRATNVVTMAIHKGAGACDPGPIPLVSSKASLVAVLSRSRLKSQRANLADQVTDDARILVRAGNRQPVLTRTDFPPAGTCVTSTSNYQNDQELAISVSSLMIPASPGLDDGAAMKLLRQQSVDWPPDFREIGKILMDEGNYKARLGAGGPVALRGIPPLFLEPGRYRLEAPGGNDAGPFAPEFSMPAAFRWTDRDQLATVDRARGLTLHWTLATPAAGEREPLMAIVVRNVDRISTAIGMCLCTAKASAGQFTVPAAMLANIPASINAPGERYDKLVLGSMTATVVPATRTKGLEEAIIFSVHDNSRVVDFR